MIDVEQVRQFLLTFAICTVRITAACSVAPFLSTQIIPGQVRNSIVFSWVLIVYPIVAPTLNVETGATLALLALIVKELVLGVLIGFVAAKAFWVAVSVGFFIDNQRGASMASVFDPMSGDQTSPIGQFLQQAMTALFYTSGGFLVFLGGVFDSYSLWPVDSFYPILSREFPGFVLQVADDVMRLIVVLAAPIIIAVFISELGLGLVNRFAPQLNVFFLAMPVKSLVALFVLLLYLPFLLSHFDDACVGGDELLMLLRGVLL